MPIPTRPSAILFDLDNTVYPYAPCHAEGLAAVHGVAAGLSEGWAKEDDFLAAYDAARARVKARTHGQAAEHNRLLYFKEMLDAHGPSDFGAIRRLHAAYWLGYFRHMRPDPGCLDLLHDLRAAGVRLAWVTDQITERQMLKLTALGLEQAADVLVTSEESGAEKPDPRGVRLALEKLGVDPAQAWFVGDDYTKDVGAARAAGVTAIWFRRGPNPPTPIPALAERSRERGAADRPHADSTPQGREVQGGPAADATVDDWHSLRRLWEEVARD